VALGDRLGDADDGSVPRPQDRVREHVLDALRGLNVCSVRTKTGLGATPTDASAAHRAAGVL
jgi:hypothetical protein